MTPPPHLPIGSTHKVDVITAASPHNFYVQLVSRLLYILVHLCILCTFLQVSPDVAQQLESIEKRIEDLNISRLLSLYKTLTYNKGALILAPYNGKYYRANIIGNNYLKYI